MNQDPDNGEKEFYKLQWGGALQKNRVSLLGCSFFLRKLNMEHLRVSLQAENNLDSVGDRVIRASADIYLRGA